MNSRRGNIFNFNSNVLLTWKIKYYTQVNGIYEIPGDEWMSSDLLSRVWIIFLNPQSASTSLIFIFMTRLSSCLWKTGCSFKSSTIITSPGSSPGSWSPSPWNVIFCPSFIPVIKTIIHILLERLKQKLEPKFLRKVCVLLPLSMWTSRIFFLRSTLCPLQFLQRSLELNLSPCPWQSEHMLWICWIIPGPICCTWTWTPLPLQVEHFSIVPFLPP